MMTETKDPTVTIKLILAWVWVGIPLAWGVWVTLNNAIKLFQPPAT
jgi:hypothetical protein